MGVDAGGIGGTGIETFACVFKGRRMRGWFTSTSALKDGFGGEGCRSFVSCSKRVSDPPQSFMSA